MSLFRKILLYISSFVPLYFLIIVKELIDIINDNLSFNVTNSVMISFNLLLIIMGVIGVVIAYKDNRKSYVKINSYKNVTRENFLPYFPLFVLFALAFELEFISMAIVYVLILVMVGIVYVKNQLFYINPLLNILGFNIYEVEVLYGERVEKTYLYSTKNILPKEGFINSNFIKK